MNVVLKNNKNKSTSNKSQSLSFSSETALFFLTLLLWIDRILLTYIRAFALRLPFIGSLTDYFIIVAYAFLIVFSIPQILKHLRLGDFIFLFVTVIICVLNHLLFVDNVEVSNEFLPVFLFLTFPLYFVGVSLDFEKVYPWLYRLSLITIASFTVYKLFFSAPMTDVESLYAGDMWSAYNVLPHVCVVALAALKKPGLINIAMTVTGIVMIALLGSRGPLLCAVLAIIVYLIFFKRHKHPFLTCFSIIAVAMVVIIQLNTIMQVLYELADSAGLSIRIFDKFFEGTFSDSSDRDKIAVQLYERIAENPVFGYGLFSDRVATGTYAHNIAIELWHAFGVFFGTAILGGIVVILGRAAIKVKKIEQYALLYIPLFFAGFVKLFLSGSILNELYLFMLLGFSVNLMRPRKYH